MRCRFPAALEMKAGVFAVPVEKSKGKRVNAGDYLPPMTRKGLMAPVSVSTNKKTATAKHS